MLKKTNVMRILDSLNIQYKTYDYTGTAAISGVEVASALGQNPSIVYKTLVTVAGARSCYVFIVPVAQGLDLKKAANIVSEKKIEMIKSKDLLSITGYIHGGCSPIGMKKKFKTVIHPLPIGVSNIIFSGGKIGSQVEIVLDDLKKVLDFQVADIII